MRGQGSPVSGLVVVLLVSATAATAGVAAGAPTDPATETGGEVGVGGSPTLARERDAGPGGANDTAFDPDSVLMRVELRPDGDATWQVEYHFHLDDDADRSAFRSLRDDVAANRSSYTAAFADRIRPSVTAAERETGREMAVENVTVAVREQQLAQPTGILTYRFTWRSFARADGNSIDAGDALNGFYVGPSTTLTLTWPEGYELSDAVPGPDAERGRRLSWEGELGFANDEPRVVLRQPADGTGGSTRTETDTASAGGGPLAGVSPLLLGAVGLLLVVLGTGGALAVRRTGDGATASGGGVAGATTADPALLSDEERALAAIDNGGGRIKQQELADACEWGDSKTSRVVSRLQEDGDVEVYRLGRENVLALPEETDDI
jgi:hypothetical protein